MGFSLPLNAVGQSSAFARIMRPQGVALPVLNMGAWLQRDGAQVVEVRIAVGPAGPTPTRGTAAEDVLRGGELCLERMERALAALLHQVHYRTSPHRATLEYRRLLTRSLMADVLGRAWERGQRVMEVSR